MRRPQREVGEGEIELLPFLEMLVVFFAAPVATPLEYERFKHLFTEVGFIYFMGKVLVSVHIISRRAWLDERTFDVRIL